MKTQNQLFGRIAVLLVAAGITVSAQAISVSADERACPSGLAFDKIEEKVENVVNQSTAIPDDPDMLASLETIVFCGDEILYEGYLGEIDRENHIPADENSVYEWGSISKTMIWVSAMQLWEQGKLDLDADIRNYLPEDFFQHLSYDDPITMTNLMNHEGGWCEATYSMGTTDENQIPTLAEALRAIEPKQVFRPGEVTSYSNWGAALAAYVVECISGMDYSDYVHQNILVPLGMEHTSVSASYRDNEWVWEQRQKLKSYQFKMLTADYKSLGTCIDYITLYPSGSATGTIRDLATYAQAFVNDDAPLFQHPETQEKLFSGSAFFGDSDIPSSSYGFGVTEQAVRTFGHNGATNACISNMLFDRESKVGFVALTNEPAGNYIYEQLPTWIFGSLSAEKYASENTAAYPISGYYANARSHLSGLLKSYTLLGAVPAENFGNITNLGSNLYQISGSGNSALLGGKTYSDGNTGFNLGSSDLIYDKMYIPKLCLLTAFYMLAVASVFILLIKRKMRKSNKLQPVTGLGILTAGQIAKVVSVLTLVILISYAAKRDSYGLPKAIGISAGVVHIICMALCAAAALVSVYALLVKKPKKLNKIRYICNIAGNVLTVCTMICFEMYQFWSC